MSANPEERTFRNTKIYIIGQDLTLQEYETWKTEIALWLSQSGRETTDPLGKAEKIIKAAVHGTTLGGEPWIDVENFQLHKRILQFCGYNILTKQGRTAKRRRSTKKELKQYTDLNTDILGDATREELVVLRDAYRTVLVQEFPFLDNPVYETKVNAYCDTVVKLQVLSDKFLGAEGKELTRIIELRDSLKKDLDDFMKLLRIHPSQLKEKVDEKDKGDVGSLIDKWESYGELANLYETVDAVQEALQILKQLETTRLDGSPQLAEWLLWHKTGCRGHTFRCPCGAEYTIHGGFTIEEMYQIVEQAHKVLGYGAKPTEDKRAAILREATESKANG